jgi:hypothetical protein
MEESATRRQEKVRRKGSIHLNIQVRYGCTQRGGEDQQQQPRAAGTRREETPSQKRRARRPQGTITSSEKEEKKEAQQRSTIAIRINAAAALTDIRGMYMGGAHHDVGSLSRKLYTQCVG